MREQATQKLVKAYRLDEIACSVATMQSASSLEDVASLVLQRNPHDPDAKYVHFFHEKIPSRQLAECTSLAPLNDVVAERPTDPEPLRTRAMVRVFKGDFQGAVEDLTEALKLHRLYRPAHAAARIPPQDGLQQGSMGRRQEDVVLKEEDQPTSLEMQLLFQRAGVYLAVACRHVAAALPPASSVPPSGTRGDGGPSEGEVPESRPGPPLSPAEREEQRRMAEARKLVRQNAKRALRDYTAYLSHFEYSPDLPIAIAEDFTRKVNSAVNGARVPRSHPHSSGPRSPVAGDGEGGAADASHRVYALSDLFTSSPPTGLPPYPSTEVAPRPRQQPSSPGAVQTTTEILTCHPLLTDALHALLLCHCLIQTSAKELLRHAYMVARLARLADGYPVFQSSRCPSRADWIEVLRAGGNWIQLAGSWEDLCAPTPLPLFQSAGAGSAPVPVANPPQPKQPKTLPAAGSDSAPTRSEESPAALARHESPDSAEEAETEKQRRDRIHQQAVLDALGDDRVSDEPSLRMAIRARQLRAEHDYRLDNAVAALDAKFAQQHQSEPDDSSSRPPATPVLPDSGGTVNGDRSPKTTVASRTPTTTPPPPTTAAAAPTATPSPRQATVATAAAAAAAALDDGRDYSILTERASAIARWVLEAPAPSVSDGAARSRRKKRPVRRKEGVSVSATAAAAAAASPRGMMTAGQAEGDGGGDGGGGGGRGGASETEECEAG